MSAVGLFKVVVYVLVGVIGVAYVALLWAMRDVPLDWGND